MFVLGRKGKEREEGGGRKMESQIFGHWVADCGSGEG